MTGRPLTLGQKCQVLKDRYFIMAGPLLLLVGVVLASSEPMSTAMAWVAGMLFVVLTVNRFVS